MGAPPSAPRVVIAAASEWAKDLRVEWHKGTLGARPGPGGFLMCGDRLQLAPGRNHFREAGAALFGARCRSDLIDAAQRIAVSFQHYFQRTEGELSSLAQEIRGVAERM